MTRSTEHKESFVRWQGITIAQLGYVINLLLAFATASLGFGFSFVRECTFHPNCFVRINFGLSLFLLLLSVVAGLLCVNNRLTDFRKTKDIARDREQWCRDGVDPPEIDARLSGRRTEVKTLGEKTWNLFRWQIWCFGLGAFFLVLTLAVAYWGKV
jgi:hypothetical protein